jgi:hypothetical protein
VCTCPILQNREGIHGLLGGVVQISLKKRSPYVTDTEREFVLLLSEENARMYKIVLHGSILTYIVTPCKAFSLLSEAVVIAKDGFFVLG